MTNKYHLDFKLKWFCIAFHLLLVSAPVSAAEKVSVDAVVVQGPITGKIVDNTGLPLPGVSVLVKGTNIGTVTDIDGNYSITPNSANATLVFSFVGFKTQEVLVGGKSAIDISMSEDSTTLNEVVVVGYGTQKRSDITGSVASIPTERLKNLPATNISQAIQGSTAGVTVIQGSNVPGSTGSIKIRGNNSLTASGNPFLVVDGIPFEGGSLNDIPAADIKNIEILKDASAVAIYGTRGSNGVILITTKRGATGKPSVSYNTYYAVEEIAHMLTPMSPDAFLQKYADYKIARNINDTNPLLNQSEIDNYNAGRTTDWMDVVTKAGSLQEHNLSVSGGNENAKYMVSGNWLEQDGVVQGYQYRRSNFRANFDFKINNAIKLGGSAFYAHNNYDGGRANLLLASAMSPFSVPYNDNGSLIINPMSPELLYENPLLGLKTAREERRRNLNGSAFAEITPSFAKGLKYRLNASYSFQPGRVATYKGREANDNNGTAYIYDSERRYWIVENLLFYDRTFGKHHIDLTALYSSQENRWNDNSTTGVGFVNDELTFNNIGSAATITAASYQDKRTLLSQMGRANYAYDDRYLGSVTVRRDGSSVFGVNTSKYATFTSGAIGWNASNEKFLKDIKQIDLLKLRLSYGQSGNEAVGVYGTLSLAGTTQYPFSGAAQTGTFITDGLANPNLKWETTTTSNAAVDFGFFGNRLSGTVEYYKSETDDLLMRRSIPTVTGSTFILDNIGSVENKGIEISLNTVNIKTENFKWETSVNYSKVKNKITKLNGSGEDDIVNRWFIGKPIGAIYDYQMEGIWQTGEDPSGQDPGAVPGDIKFRDLNGDGVIDAANDRKYLGTSLPKWTGGITNRFTYKNFNLSVFVYTSQGSLKGNPDLNYGDEVGRRNIPAEVGYWTPDNQSNSRPSLGYFNTRGYGYPKDASFVRLQDVRLSYAFDKDLIGKAGIENLTIYVSGRNLYTWTNWVGWDPENNFSYRGSGDWTNNYPQVRSISLGLNLNL
ncbi:TonB-dependent receptor [Flavobacterium sp.]|uniref:SusC/RagA family TonB-linked outer membrane protein n=1 Tax=Flavobacterium sp. TaxID=239 RepID=UPI00120A8687|nr:TonB-dependent receptor [Flavobacterium sp.]RZJ73817.1 MAG: TonB-dependent receptor [Flavobacterium sp.]